VSDLGSQNGVFVNSERIRAAHVLSNSDTITLGTYHFVFSDQGEADPDIRSVRPRRQEVTQLEEPEDPVSEDDDDALLVPKYNDVELQRFARGTDRCLSARAKDCDVQFAERRLSRRHCEIIQDADRFIVQDLGSQNGTYVNGERCSMQPLKDGDKIRVGDTTILKFGIHDALDEQFQQQLYKAALRDDLTGAYNKKYLLDQLGKEFRFALRHRTPLSFVMIDIDNFKKVNDTYGHLIGDRILRQMANLLRREQRAVDIVARYGGEEFVILLPETGVTGARIFAERILRRVAGNEFGEPGHPVHLTTSIGVATYPDDRIDDGDGMLRLADENLYKAKNAGRNRFKD